MVTFPNYKKNKFVKNQVFDEFPYFSTFISEISSEFSEYSELNRKKILKLSQYSELRSEITTQDIRKILLNSENNSALDRLV